MTVAIVVAVTAVLVPCVALLIVIVVPRDPPAPAVEPAAARTVLRFAGAPRCGVARTGRGRRRARRRDAGRYRGGELDVATAGTLRTSRSWCRAGSRARAVREPPLHL